jgi:hypothetical protein
MYEEWIAGEGEGIVKVSGGEVDSIGEPWNGCGGDH